MRHRLVLAVVAVVLLASCNSGDDSSTPPTTSPVEETTTTLPSTPVVAKVVSPEPGSVQGSGGKGMVVVLTFTAKDSTVLPAEFRVGGELPPPATAAKPGHNPAFPGLVVGMSTTAASVGGPETNLANLFQIVSPSVQPDGSVQVSAVWTNAAANFGTDTEVLLAAFTMAGTAPDKVTPPLPDTVTSNVASVTFRLSAAGSAGVGLGVVGTASTTTTTPRATTTTRRVTTSTTVRGSTTTTGATAAATTTTARPAVTTTVPPATTTTRFLGIF
jgi:hypothetical protein